MSNPTSAIQLLRVVHPFDAFELYIQGPTQSRAPPCSQAGKSSPTRVLSALSSSRSRQCGPQIHGCSLVARVQ